LTRFNGYTDTSFVVLPDQVSVIGCVHDSFDLHAEKINSNKINFVSVKQHKYDVDSLIYDETTCTLLAADNDSIIQYKKQAKNKWKIVKKYSKTGIHATHSNIRIGNLVIFGGHYYRFIVIDILKKKIILKPFKTMLYYLFSLQIFQIKSTQNPKKIKYGLLVTGIYPDGPKNKSDCLDITSLVKKHVNKNILTKQYVVDEMNEFCIKSSH
jgi:hypothetical protein